MQIRIEPHTLQRAEERGTNAEEIADVLRTGVAVPAKSGRLAKAKVYPFGQTRLGKYYEQKRVEVIYTVEEGTIITVTVYVFYGRWEE
ncbi:MAG: DUF4258 domain-containing protein [Armatimonadetes bacterium]|nr:DUF4258 domain-containing protein [Armatimonadota bacterium]